VRQIIDDVRLRGDAALFDYTLKFDRVNLGSLEVSREQIAGAYQDVDAQLISALKLAAERIRSFHQAQREAIWHEVAISGARQIIRPLKRIGIHTPGFAAPLPSSLLMTAIPAKVAGVEELVVATPPGPDGKVASVTLVAADIAEVDRVFSVAGAQAIAALAYGTESVPRVDKVCGPGNIFVVLAKKLVYGVVDIDGLQGPSEVLVIADDTAHPEHVAADLLAQAEHGPSSSAILVTTSAGLAEAVARQTELQLKGLPRQIVAGEALGQRGIIVVVDNIDEAIEVANYYAPEHLCLAIDNPRDYIDRITNAGCVFIGRFSPVALGDYVAGPSHVLPTAGTARFASPLNVTDFIKFINLVSVDEADYQELAEAASVIARAEGLDAHARALEKRWGGE